jgi:hypothetical protein
MGQIIESVSVWRLRYDLLSVRLMLLLVGRVSQEDLKPEVHLYLGDRYQRLADHLARRGLSARAGRLDDKARWHYAQAGFDDFPRAAAMAMPVPRPRIFTDARGKPLDRRDPDDAA